MADELQALFDRIDQDALKKADEQCAQRLAAAQKDAAKIIADARAQAAAIVAAAKSDAATMQQKSEEALRQSARELFLELRAELQKRISSAVTSLLRGQSLAPEALSGIIAQICSGYLAKQGETTDIALLVPAEQLTALESAVKAQLAEELKARVSFAPSKAFAAGFQLSFRGDAVLYDFSDESLAEAIAAHVSPALGALITKK